VGMGKATWIVSFLCIAACGRDTGIVLQISKSPALQEDFAQLRVWVGHATDDPSFFRASEDAFFTTPRTSAQLATPYRYLLEPTGELADIGPIVFAAAVGNDPEDVRLPFQIVGFDVAAAPMTFADDEIRVVSLELAPPDGVQGGIDDECIVWGMDTGDPSRIAPADDLDCDGAVGQDDCNDLDPSQNRLDRDGDGVASCAGDCMDDPRIDVRWLDPATVHPGAIDIGENDPQSCDHVDEDCDGVCQPANADFDGSGSTACGEVASDGNGICHGQPADCDEQTDGNQPLNEGAPEACNARDDACDGFLPPPLPCVFDGGGGICHWGMVKCDEKEGEYEGEVDGSLHCKSLPDGFSTSTAPEVLCGTTIDQQCLEAGDPIACSFTGTSGPRANCHVSASLQCRPDRLPLVFPGPAPVAGCEWHVVGGTQQAEWEVGFVDANAPLDAAPQETIRTCQPVLAARSSVARPSPRAVLVLLRSADDESFGARPMVIFLENDGGAECSGALICESEPGPL
jgi:hypothetical protein